MKTLFLTAFLVASPYLHASDQKVPSGEFLMAVAGDGPNSGFPAACVATVRVTGDLTATIKFSSSKYNKWEIPLQFRTFSPKDKDGCGIAFDGATEISTAEGSRSFRISGRLLPDGSMQGVWLQHGSFNANPGFASVGKFALQPSDAQQAGRGDGDKPSN